MLIRAYEFFDGNLSRGQPVLARWTSGARSYEAPAVVTEVLERSVGVRLLQPPPAWGGEWHFRLPRWFDVKGWSEVTSVWPPGETRDLAEFAPLGPAPEWATPAAAKHERRKAKDERPVPETHAAATPAHD